MKAKIKVWIAVRMQGNSELIDVFDSYDEIYGLYDFTEQVEISQITHKKLSTGDYYAARFSNTIRAYRC